MKSARPTIVLIRGAGIDDGNRCIPFGLLGIKSFLEKHGHSAQIIDRHLFRESIKESVQRVMLIDPPFVGISAMTAQMSDALALASALRKHGYRGKIIFGGTHVTFDPQSVQGITDYVIRKEGEQALKMIVEGAVDPATRVLDGVFIDDLDQIPIPDIETFRQVHPPGIGHFNVFTARGCPFKCSFCLSPEQREPKIRFHSVGYVLDTIKRICTAIPCRRMFVMDDIFTLRKDRVMDFCEQLRRDTLGLSWWCFTHARCGDSEMYRAMKDAGCVFVSMGVESGNPDVLQLNHKDIMPEQVLNKVTQIIGAGLKVEAQFLLGLLGDNVHSMRDTIELAVEVRKLGADVSCGYVQPYPGAEMYDKAGQYGRFLTTDKRLFFRKFITYLPKGVTLRQMLEMHYQFEKLTRGRYERQGWNLLKIKHRMRHWPIYYYYDFMRRRLGLYD